MCLRVEQLLSRSESHYDKFEQCGETRCMEEAIILDPEALNLCTPGHSERSACSVALSWDIWTRYEQLG